MNQRLGLNKSRYLPISSIPTLLIPTLSIPIWSMLTKLEVDQMGIDKVGIDKVGIDKVGINPNPETITDALSNQPLGRIISLALTCKHGWVLYSVLISATLVLMVCQIYLLRLAPLTL